MFEKLAHGIPLAEAADYFIRLKTFEKVADATTGGGASYAPPDETGQLEGQFNAPIEQVIAHMAKMVQNELKTQYAYMTYANSLRGHDHFAIADEFEQHAHMETEHADWLLRRMAVLGGPVAVPDIPAPPASTAPEEILPIMIRMEQEGIENWRILRQMIGDENPSKFKVEEFLTREQEHLDELWQMTPEGTGTTAMMAATGGASATTMPPLPGKSEPDVNQTLKEPEQQGSKTAGPFLGMLGGAENSPEGSHLGGAVSGLAAGAGTEALLHALTSGSSPLVQRAAAWGSLPASFLAGMAAGRGYSELKKKILGPKGETEEKTASARIERCHLDTLRHHGEAMKLALMSGSTRGTTIVPDLGMDGELKTAAAKMRKAATGAMPPPLPETAQGKQTAPPPPAPLMGAAAGQVMKSAAFKTAMKKLALSEDTVPAGTSQTPAVSDKMGTPEKDAPPLGMPPEPTLDDETLAYLQREQAGTQAEQQASENFYKQKFEAATQQLNSLQEQASAAQQQLDQYNQSQQQMMQQNQTIQQAAVQNAQAAHAAATQAMQQSLSAQKETISQQQLSVGMRDAVHALKQSLMQQVQQQLPPATTVEANAMAIDQANAQQSTAGQATEQPSDMNAQAAASGGQDNSKQPGAAGEEQPKNTSGQPNAAPEEQAPGSPAPGGTGPEDSPMRGEGKKPLMEGAEPQGESSQSSQQPPISVKVGSAEIGSSEDLFVSAIMGKLGSFGGAAIGALGGALAGGLGGYAESRSSNDPLRAKVKKLEEQDRAGGGFGNALNLAQAKARLALSEFSENHPSASTALSAGIGAAHGATLGHHLSK